MIQTVNKCSIVEWCKGSKIKPNLRLQAHQQWLSSNSNMCSRSMDKTSLVKLKRSCWQSTSSTTRMKPTNGFKKQTRWCKTIKTQKDLISTNLYTRITKSLIKLYQHPMLILVHPKASELSKQRLWGPLEKLSLFISELIDIISVYVA